MSKEITRKHRMLYHQHLVGLMISLVSMMMISFASPPLQHGRNYTEEFASKINLNDYWVSEKLDGVRGYWDGEKLLSRQGYPIQAPNWFTQDFGEVALDGELWIGRNRFDEVSSIIRQNSPENPAWKKIKLMVFDLPSHSGNFDERIRAMNQHINALNLPWLKKIEQIKLSDETALNDYLKAVVAKGGEGLMLHRGDAYYQEGRFTHLLKVKEVHDQEGTVLAYFTGKGKYTGMMGSLLIELDNGIQFRLGTGFTDNDRIDPPPIGSRVTFQYNGYTKNGIPRFARFLRIRDDEVPHKP